MRQQAWHVLPWLDVVKALEVHPGKGLNLKEVNRRLGEVGRNILETKKGVHPVFLFLGQFKDFMVLVLLAATIVSALLGEIADAVTIMAILVLNAVLGFIQEFRAERSIESLKSLTAPEARVLRDGLESRIPAADLVPGDIVLLEAGDRIPADIRWIQAVNVEVEESALTGESHPVAKRVAPLTDELTPMADRVNMGYMGTSLVSGRGAGVVVATGMETEMGVIAGMIQSVEEEETPLQKRLAQLGKYLVVISIIVCGIVVLTGVLRGEGFYKMFLAGVSLAVAAIPEGLPAIVTVALAIGVQRMVKRKAIIRKLPAVETLGCATVICSDKTGTLTQNEMTVRQIYTDRKMISVTGQGYDPKGDFHGADPAKEKSPLQVALKIASLCNNSSLNRKGVQVAGMFRAAGKESPWGIEGDPTEGALLVAAAKAGIWRETLERKEERVGEIPFDSDRKRMSVIYKGKREKKAYVKGAPDEILRRCRSELTSEGIVELNEIRRRAILKANDEMAKKALRVLALAEKPLQENERIDERVEEDLIFVGLMGMIDPPRASAAKAIKVCRKAGIKPVMITGDHRLTAEAVARELGILKGNADVILTGSDLDRMSDEELEKEVMNVSVYARVTPKDKLRIVRALKKNDQVVAMTGDGVNDAPAVKEADIGVSMGKTGTDVTKEASAMVLADDNFATIVAAVEEGRAIYDNIRKFIRYLLSCNIGEVLVMFLAALVGLPLPLLAIQILWVNLVTDGLPAMALGVDGMDKDIMNRRPRDPGESIFARGLARKILIRGTIIGLGTLLVFVIALFMGVTMLAARTMAFTTLVFSQLFHVFDCKSETRGIFEVGIFSNPYLVAAVIGSTLMQLSVIYIAPLQAIFKTTALTGWQWALILLVAGGPSILIGLYRLIRNAWRGKEIMVSGK
ncbi:MULTISPECIES: calcium-transporting P-type ATPase, PMR1-type [Desulfitobacterium]|uniref:P-type Ca(2+) transporter n=1 Tax=Desulfitobacterium dehalogenans (strain ATCC 51507 / DSM 9161 / JW/IU-DC1) TaxID=756499 RepID=I4ACF7_DESDJ|nr:MULTISPECIES: calcium-transporting P-type ATPase, PMR1-type [Desulfitobacterium]AFM01642.1 sarco/endoplasmic reticulum calcium-translocating P-type ATPase/golgi membrane calcium-translocating P-type ATPase [Desulfitobacterium dehalogenans ATCC 51507]